MARLMIKRVICSIRFAAYICLWWRKLCPGLRRLQHGRPLLSEAKRIGKVERRWVFRFVWHGNNLHTISQARSREPRFHSLATAIRLNHNVDRWDTVKKWRIALVLPVLGARKAQRWFVVKPEGMTVGRALNQRDIATFARLGELPLAIGNCARAVPPLKAFACRRLFQGNSELCTHHYAPTRVIVRNADRRIVATAWRHIRQT